MKIAILTNEKKLFSPNRLKAAAKARGHNAYLLHTPSFSIAIEQGAPALFVSGKPVKKYDAVIPRIPASFSFQGTAVLRQFEQLGVFTLNSSHAVAIAHDKLRTMQILSRHQVQIPPTAGVFKMSDIRPTLEEVGGAPVVIKLLSGSQGVGVMLAETNTIAVSILEALQATQQNVLVQRFISESRGRDIRAFVVGDRVVAAMRRIAQGDEFRSNVHQGGTTEVVSLDPAYERVAVLVANILGLRVAGVDILEGNEGPIVMEVNSSPGLEGIEQATGVDIADTIIAYLEEEVQFPEYDIRERLALGRGYAIVEIPIKKKSMLAGQSIADSHLNEQEVQVLSITRGGLIIPSPAPVETIQVGDMLLCFGKQGTLKGLLPPKSRRRVKTVGSGATES